MYPVSAAKSISTEVKLGETNFTLVIFSAIQLSSISTNCLSPDSPAASPQRTGYPISLSFSNMQTETPPFAASQAAIEPAGPPPTTTTSYLFCSMGLQYFYGTYFNTEVAINTYSMLNFNGIFPHFYAIHRTDRNTNTTIITSIVSYTNHVQLKMWGSED